MKIGDYEALECVGRGGMGAVYQGLATDGSLVAVKVLTSTDSGRALERFQREQRLVELLGDSGGGFVSLIASGVHQGRPFLVMPFLPGGTLRDRITRGPLAVDQVASLGITLAKAMGRAHKAGVVHRDLKPENVLFDARARPVIADLGLAKHFRNDSLGASRSVEISHDGTRLGTAGFMAPEQAVSAKSVGPPSDVFSLGSLLYECLAGEPAYEGRSISEITAKTKAGQFRPLRDVRPETPAPLAQVIERCLAPSPAARYLDGAELALALEAAVQTPGSKGTSGVRRPAGGPRRPASVIGLVVALAIGGGVAIGFAWLKAPAPEPAPASSPRPSSAAAIPVTPASPAPVAAPTWQPIPEFYRRLGDGRTLRLAAALGPTEGGPAAPIAGLGFAADSRAVTLGQDGSVQVWDLTTGKLDRTLLAPGEVVAGGTVGDGTTVEAIGKDGGSISWEVATGRELRRTAGGVCLRADPDTASGERGVARGERGGATGGAGERGAATGLPAELRAAAVGGDGSVFLAVGRDGATIRESASGQARRFDGSRAPATVALSSDGTRAAVAGDDGRVAVVDVATGAVRRVFGPLTAPVRQVAIDGHGAHVVALFYRDEVPLVWDVDSGQALPSFGKGVDVRAAAFASDGEHLVTGHGDGAIRWCETATGKTLAVIAEGGGESVNSIALSPDATRALTASRDRTIRLWDLERARDRCIRTLAEPTPAVNGVADVGSGAVVALDSTPRARELDLRTGEARRQVVFARTKGGGGRATMSADGRRFAAIGDDGLSLSTLAQGVVGGPYPTRPYGRIPTLAFTPDARRVVALAQRERVVAWEFETGFEVEPTEPFHAAATAPAGSWIPARPNFVAPFPGGQRALVSGQEHLFVEDVKAGRVVVTLDAGAPECAVVLPDALRALVGTSAGRLAFVDLDGGGTSGSFEAHHAAVKTLALSSDGTRAASASVDRHLKLWDLTQDPPRELDDVDLGLLPDRPTSVAFSRDNRGLVVGTGRGAVLVFEPR